MRYPASEKLEIIRIVEQSHLPAKLTLDKLGVSRGFFATERGILDIEGVNNLQRCAEAVKAQQFQDCQPSILVAPVNREGLQAPPPPEFDPLKSGKVPLASLPLAPRLETGQAGLIGVAVVFTDTIEEIYRDAQLTQRAPSLPADAYLLYDILFASDPQIGVNDGQPAGGQAQAGDVLQQLERQRCGRLIVLVVGDQLVVDAQARVAGASHELAERLSSGRAYMDLAIAAGGGGRGVHRPFVAPPHPRLRC